MCDIHPVLSDPVCKFLRRTGLEDGPNRATKHMHKFEINYENTIRCY